MAISTPDLKAPARAAITLSPDLRVHRVEVSRWALAQGRPLNLDAITVVLAVRRFEADTDGQAFTRWTSQRLIAFLWGSAVEWCDVHGVEMPEALNESLWTYFSYLDRTKTLAGGSSQLSQLRDVLVEMGGLTKAGRSRVGRSNGLGLLHPLNRQSG
jgi:hypothetical protein